VDGLALGLVEPESVGDGPRLADAWVVGVADGLREALYRRPLSTQ
jgi:hypothetical protein